MKPKIFFPMKPILIIAFFFLFMIFIICMAGINWISTNERNYTLFVIIAASFLILVMCLFFIPFLTCHEFRIEITEKGVNTAFYIWKPEFSSYLRKVCKKSIQFSEITLIRKEVALFRSEKMPFRPVIIFHLLSSEIVYCQLIGYTKKQLLTIWTRCIENQKRPMIPKNQAGND
jgi:magnesium-transporting ATPase (P-type)